LKIDISEGGQVSGDEEFLLFLQIHTFNDKEVKLTGFSLCG